MRLRTGAIRELVDLVEWCAATNVTLYSARRFNSLLPLALVTGQSGLYSNAASQASDPMAKVVSPVIMIVQSPNQKP